MSSPTSMVSVSETSSIDVEDSSWVTRFAVARYPIPGYCTSSSSENTLLAATGFGARVDSSGSIS
jgi:hypothetical protein